MKQSFYHLKSAIENIKLNQTMVVFSLISLSLTLMLFGVFLLFYYNVTGFVQSMRESVQFSIYLKEGVDAPLVERIDQALKKDTRISSFVYISKDEALKTFSRSFEDQGLVERLGGNPFPASFEVKVKTSHQDSKVLGEIIAQFEGFSGVEEIQYGSEWLKNLLTFLKLLRVVGVGIGVFLAVTVMTNIANTIRLHFYNRREEIEIMKLIGATHRFIKVPFVMEGVLMGGISGIFSASLLFVVYFYSKDGLLSILGGIGSIQAFQFLPVNILVGLVCVGSLLGGIGSFISLNHLLRLRNPGHETKKR